MLSTTRFLPLFGRFCRILLGWSLIFLALFVVSFLGTSTFQQMGVLKEGAIVLVSITTLSFVSLLVVTRYNWLVFKTGLRSRILLDLPSIGLGMLVCSSFWIGVMTTGHVEGALLWILCIFFLVLSSALTCMFYLRAMNIIAWMVQPLADFVFSTIHRV